MKNENLLSFYLGADSESERLRTERLLLADPEALLAYFELKRQIEKAKHLELQPSAALWARLERATSPTYTIKSRRTTWAVALGGAVAACAAFIVLTQLSSIQKATRQGPQQSYHPSFEATHYDKVIFDSNSELSASSNVL
jgi:ferric-dicitrate binding protein FerR (iron transport regulator)